MTVRLIRMMAKEFAGQYYEQEQRSLRFRRTWPAQDVYVARNWSHFYKIAREAVAALLHRPGYPEHLKEAIYRDLLEEQERQHGAPNALTPIQADFDFQDRREKKALDESHNLPAVSG
jgi:hypothetical protein